MGVVEVRPDRCSAAPRRCRARPRPSRDRWFARPGRGRPAAPCSCSRSNPLVERRRQRVGRQHVHAPADHERGRVRPRVHRGAAARDGRARVARQTGAGAALAAPGRGGGLSRRRPAAGRARARRPPAPTGCALATLLEADVVVGAHTGDAWPAPPGAGPGPGGGPGPGCPTSSGLHPLAPGAQELADAGSRRPSHRRYPVRPATEVAVALPGSSFPGRTGALAKRAARRPRCRRMTSTTQATNTAPFPSPAASPWSPAPPAASAQPPRDGSQPTVPRWPSSAGVEDRLRRARRPARCGRRRGRAPT